MAFLLITIKIAKVKQRFFMCQILLIIFGLGAGRTRRQMCSVFKETLSFHQAIAMTTINVYRSLTISSIINSFLKVIVLMHLLTTSGSFVGDPIGGPRRGALHHFNNNNNNNKTNKMMTAATQIAPGSFKEVPAASLVLKLPTITTTTIIQKMKNITESSFVEKFNLLDEEDCLVEDLVKYTNSTPTTHRVVNLEDTFHLVRPFLPIYYNKNISDRIVWLSDEEVFLRPMPYASILDGIAAELYHGIERLAKWNGDPFVILFRNAKVGCDLLNAHYAC